MQINISIFTAFIVALLGIAGICTVLLNTLKDKKTINGYERLHWNYQNRALNDSERVRNMAKKINDLEARIATMRRKYERKNATK